MITIINMSPERPAMGIHKYHLLINNKLVVEFEHKRNYGELARCLRDAADAVEKAEEEKITKLIAGTLGK